MGHRFKRVPEKNEKINLAVSNLRADLLITP
jgi:hypothetical protein